jgi:hypothetical protein
MVVRTRLGIAALLVALGLMACGGESGVVTSVGGVVTTAAATRDAEGATSAAATETQIIRSTFVSGATVNHPADWTSYGAGASGSLELAITQVANVSLRDAASSEYLYGRLFTEAASIDEAMAIMANTVGVTDPTLKAFTSTGGRAILYALSDVNGAESLLAVTESEGAYASVFAPSLGGSIPPDATTAILEVLASITP